MMLAKFPGRDVKGQSSDSMQNISDAMYQSRRGGVDMD
jgi:hypothetical protein